VKNRRLTRRRSFLLGLGASVATGACAITNRPKQLNDKVQGISDHKRDFTVVGDAPLRERAAAKNLIYGAATGYQILSSDSAFAQSFAKECGMLAPENALKLGVLRPSATHFDFTEGDALAEFARAHNMLFRGHTLVWGYDFGGSEWLRNTVNSENAERVLIRHIKTVVGHYAGEIHSWDVVNEAIDPSHGRADGLAKTQWLKFLGPDYIDLAFRTAAQADPKALLVYNGDLLDHDTPEADARRAATLNLLKNLKSKGTPVQALGIQAHLSANKPINASKLRAFLRDVAQLKLKILITELDVIDQKLPAESDRRDRTVARVYEDYLSIVLDEPAVIAVVTWGLSDRFTWHSQFNPREDKAPVRPLPLDAQLKRKLAWNALARSFDRTPQRKI
jgi:endo-1,4-beta-xylanase